MKEITRNELLKKLNIKSFAELTSDKYDTVTSYLPKMRPEVAKQVLAEVPELVSFSKAALEKSQTVIEKGLNSNNADNMQVYQIAEANAEALRELLKEEKLTFEQKQIVMDRLMEILKVLAEKNTENKKFILSMVLIFVSVLGVIITVIASVFGLKVKIPFGKIIQSV